MPVERVTIRELRLRLHDVPPARAREIAESIARQLASTPLAGAEGGSSARELGAVSLVVRVPADAPNHAIAQSVAHHVARSVR